jgi:DNA-binding NarL/FixJ family response regulator
MKPRLLLAEPQALVLEAFACLLEPEFDVVGRATDGVRLVEQALRLRPELVLMDVSLPRDGGLLAAARLRRELPGTRVVVLGIGDDPRVAADAFRAGANGYVLRSASPGELNRSLRAALRGERWLSTALVNGRSGVLPERADAPGRLGRLSPRKRAVIQLLAEGHSMKQAAAALGISTRTVAFHKYQAMQALSVTSSAQLVRFAVESRLVVAGGS